MADETRPLPGDTPPPSSTSATPSDEVRIAGRYRLLTEIGKGGQGVVYRAFDEAFHRVVALKLYRGAGLRAGGDAFAEARRLAQLRHPAIVAIFDAGPCVVSGEPSAYIAMEEVVGAVTVATYCGLRRLSEQRICRLLADVADGLHAIHAGGHVHRDVKPGNIIVSADGQAKLLDLGIAVSADSGLPADRSGTPAFMSPEHAVEGPEPVTARSDIYALGRTIQALVPSPTHGLARLLGEMTSERPSGRPASAEEVAERLRRLAGEGVGKRGLRVKWWAIAAVSAVAFTTLPDPLDTADWAERVARYQWDRQVAWVPRSTSTSSWEDVVCVALRDDEPLDDIADRLGASRPAPGDKFALRPLHGKVIEALAAAGAKAVAVDLYFLTTSGYDGALAASARASACPVIFGTSAWQPPVASGGAPTIVPELEQFPHGGLTIHTGTYGPAIVFATANISGAPPCPSMSLLAAIAALDGRRGVQNAAINGGLTVSEDGPHITSEKLVFDVYQLGQALPGDKLPAESWVSRLGVEVPPDGIMDDLTYSYEMLSTMSLAKRQQAFANRVVVIGNAREKGEVRDNWFNVPGGRSIPGYRIHASAIETLLRRTTFREPGMISFGLVSAHSQRFLECIALAAGALAGALPTRRHRLVLLAADLLFALVAVLVAWMWNSTLMALAPPVIVAFGGYAATSALGAVPARLRKNFF